MSIKAQNMIRQLVLSGETSEECEQMMNATDRRNYPAERRERGYNSAMDRKSPFPGMDPWLEQYWGDVIASLVTYIRDSLQDRLPQGIRARMQERIVLEYPQWNATRPIYPDVAVVEEEAEPTGAARQIEQSTLVMDEPEIIELAPEPRIETFVEIVDQKNDDQLITVIEVLSPANKQSGLSSQKYLQKQWELMQSGISLVEIDLLRAGTRVTLARAWRVPTEQR
ncbi:MAG TPA: DUF4058 family protein, partial [Tepidisphaeraceae bacterium]